MVKNQVKVVVWLRMELLHQTLTWYVRYYEYQTVPCKSTITLIALQNTTSSTCGKTWSPYKMKENSHRVALIINNFEWQLDKDGKPLMKTRDGAKEDADALKGSLEALGYHVICRENLTAKMMEQKLEEVCVENVRPDDDSFICYISSHGCEDGVCGVDDECVTVDELSKILEPDVCPQLKDKPKIFFVQACRGEKQVNSYN